MMGINNKDYYDGDDDDDVAAGSLWYNIEQAYLYTIILMSHLSCLYNLHTWYDLIRWSHAYVTVIGHACVK
jgi:hypothetical protein